MQNKALVIMSRYPQLGKVKTRLARTLGAESTLELYRCFLRDLAARFADWQYSLYWAYTPADMDFESYIASLVPEKTDIGKGIAQVGESFNERLYNVFRLQAQPYTHTIVIGSDSPHISRKIIEEAGEVLQESDVVLGPAEDGGYYLIGMKEAYDVFSGIPMSTNVVLEMTIEKARQQGLRVQLLETLSDVDEIEDLWRLGEILQQEPQLAEKTAAYIAQLQKERV